MGSITINRLSNFTIRSFLYCRHLKHATSISLSLRSRVCGLHIYFSDISRIHTTFVSQQHYYHSTNPHATLARRCPASIRRLNRNHPPPKPVSTPMPPPNSRLRSSSRSPDSPEGPYRLSQFTHSISSRQDYKVSRGDSTGASPKI